MGVFCSYGCRNRISINSMIPFNPIWLILGILSFAAAILINYYNNLKDAKNGHINHSKAFKIKALSCLPAIFLFASISNFRWVIALISSSFLVGSYFFLLFEMAWSLKVYNTPFHKGTATGKNRANTDKWLSHWSVAKIIALKLILCIASMWLYNFGLQK